VGRRVEVGRRGRGCECGEVGAKRARKERAKEKRIEKWSEILNSNLATKSRDFGFRVPAKLK
ncbi:848_t:CDS:1, partial [Dentiscutata erythropus]